MCLRCLHKSLSGPGADVLLHLTMVLMNSSSANSAYDDEVYDPSLFKMFSTT